MADSESHVPRDQSTAGFALAFIFAAVLVVEVLGLAVVHSYAIFEAGGPSTYDTLRAVWVGGIVVTGGLLAAELLS